MTAKKARKATKGSSVPRRKAGKTSTRRKSSGAIRQRWDAALDALTEAEAAVEKQVKSLLKRNRIDARDAASLLKSIGAAAKRKRTRATKELDERVKLLQTRVAKERKVLGRMVDDAVQSALAAFNVPSRREIAQLTRKVDALSRKIDTMKKP